jgi:hypothetical protein
MGIARGIEPERIVLVFADQFGRQKDAPLVGVDAASDPMKSGRADAAVEFLGVEFDVVEVVLEWLLADKLVNRRQRLFRFRGQRLIGQRQQAAGLLAEKCLARPCQWRRPVLPRAKMPSRPARN